jgi:selenide, water dikinase
LKKVLANVGLSSNAEDCSIVDIGSGKKLLTNIDIFTAIHDDPYIMGKIAACNVTNDLFALNALDVINYSAFLGMPTDIPDGFPEKMLQGIRDFLQSLGSDIHGGHTIYNPWPLLGGSAPSIIENDHLIPKTGVKLGDKLILTKPLGIQPIMAAYRVVNSDDSSWLEEFDLNSIDRSINMAVDLMTTSNRNVVKVIHEGKFFKTVHSMTDVTGFGLYGHLSELIEGSGLGALLSELPVIQESLGLAEIFGYDLPEGKSPEISGGMLMAVDPKNLDDFSQALTDRNVWWRQIGEIVGNSNIIDARPEFQISQVDKY